MEGQRLPGAVDPKHFPAKLWQLVNSPRCGSVSWDALGEGLLIDQRLFERELLGAGPAGEGAALAGAFFKTKNFSSFIRQLNLYGFRKLGPEPLQGLSRGGAGSSAGPLLHFYSPHFRRDRPDLLVHLKRLTSANKAKLAAGLQVPSRPPQRLLGTALHGEPLLPASTLGEAARPAALQGPSPPAQEEPLPVSASAAAAAYTDCGFVQSPPGQPPSAGECLPSGGASGQEKMMEEFDFEAILDFLDEMLSPPNAEIVPLEPVERSP
ncbi:heat shock factor protein 5-like [Melopsittacus undulatus]|uniref:heat shock factor protein 5-like n=1 Tax=Melopsittacus undulatus TaxID=13146 RepID=UPI00146ABF23|nr:heat shock factor protein 5-like [Melopsittacus undulatus]